MVCSWHGKRGAAEIGQSTSTKPESGVALSAGSESVSGHVSDNAISAYSADTERKQNTEHS